MKEDDDDIQEYISYRDAFPKNYRLPKPWVGLTDAEIAELEETTTCLANESWLRNLTRAIESKLKEKNAL